MVNGRWSVGAGPKERAKTLEERLNSCFRGVTTKEFDFYIVFETGSISRGSNDWAAPNATRLLVFNDHINYKLF